MVHILQNWWMKQGQCFWLAFTGAVLPAIWEAEPALGAGGCAVDMESTVPKSSSQCRWKAAPAIHRATPLSKALVIHNASFRAGKLHQRFRDTLQFLKNMFKIIFLEISSTNQKPGTNHVCTNTFRVKHWLLNGINWFWDGDKSLGAWVALAAGHWEVPQQHLFRIWLQLCGLVLVPWLVQAPTAQAWQSQCGTRQAPQFRPRKTKNSFGLAWQTCLTIQWREQACLGEHTLGTSWLSKQCVDYKIYDLLNTADYFILVSLYCSYEPC